MYVCLCQAVTDREIAQAAREGAQTVYDVKDRLGVGACCGSCHEQVEALLAEHATPVGPASVGIWRPALAGT